MGQRSVHQKQDASGNHSGPDRFFYDGALRLHPQGADIEGDNNSKIQCRDRIHRQIPFQKSLYKRMILISLRSSAVTGRRF